MVKFFSICLVVLLLCSCHSRRKEIARIVEEWKNKEVIFPDPLLVKVQGRDTILPDFQERKYKIREELTLPDGSILVKVGKQYNSYSCGS